MAKKQGKVKSIPVTKEQVTEGLQVLTRIGIGKIISGVKDSQGNYAVGLIAAHTVEDFSIFGLKTLVVEYENPKVAELYSPIEIKQLPLKYSQWQSAIDNGEVDSDKVVEFEIKNGFVNGIESNHASSGMFEPNEKFCIQYAKIIPQKKRMYNEEEMIEFASWLKTTKFNIEGHSANDCFKVYKERML